MATTAVTVLFFASAREVAGRARAEMSAPDGTTVAGMTDRIVDQFGPQLRPLLAGCALWVNGAPVTASTVLQAGDELAVLPPVSGG